MRIVNKVDAKVSGHSIITLSGGVIRTTLRCTANGTKFTRCFSNVAMIVYDLAQYTGSQTESSTSIPVY